MERFFSVQLQPYGSYISSFLLEVGAALFLLWIFWTLERRLEQIEATQRRIIGLGEQFTHALKEEEAGDDTALNAISLGGQWEDAAPALEKIRNLFNKTHIFAELPGTGIWLGLATYSDTSLGGPNTPLFVYFSDPRNESRPKSEAFVPWMKGWSGEELMEHLVTVLKRKGKYPGADNFDAEGALAGLREEARRLLAGQPE